MIQEVKSVATQISEKMGYVKKLEPEASNALYDLRDRTNAFVPVLNAIHTEKRDD